MSASNNRKVRFGDDKPRSGSSRASTVGGSSSGSSFSAASYPDNYKDQRYNIHALEETLRATVNEVDLYKNRVYELEEKLRKSQDESKAHVRGLENQCSNLEDDKKDLEQETKELKSQIKELKDEVATVKDERDEIREKYSSLKKKTKKHEDQPTSPDGGKVRRSDSKKVKESDSDKQKHRLEKRFVLPDNSVTSETSSSKPPNSSKITTRSNRRLSVSSHATGERPYVESYGPGGLRPTLPVHTSSGTTSPRRSENYITTPRNDYHSAPQEPYTTPRTTGHPSVEFSHPVITSYEHGSNYVPYPLPRR